MKLNALIAIVALSLVAGHAMAKKGPVCYGNKEECPVLRDVPINLVKTDLTGIKKACGGDLHARACTVHMVNSCKIWYSHERYLKHEINHCRGWYHKPTMIDSTTSDKLEFIPIPFDPGTPGVVSP